MTRTRILLPTLLALFTAAPAAAQFDNVGSIDFPTSATGEAQQHFLRGEWNELATLYASKRSLLDVCAPRVEAAIRLGKRRKTAPARIIGTIRR